GDLCQKNHAAYPQSLTIAVVTGWLYALYLSRVSSPSQVRSRFVSIPGKSGHPCSHLCLRIHSSPRSIARSHCARMPRTLQTSMKSIPLRQEALTLARVGSSTRCLPTASSTSKKLIGWLTASRSAQDGSDHFPSSFWVSRK